MNPKPSSRSRQKTDVSVPRDASPGEQPPERMPSPDTINPRDEDYADAGRPLVSGSPEARSLHAHPPRAKGELGVGTAGDAARPMKSGLHDKPIPPRESLPRG
jgi:hypothetical protein